MRRRFFIAINLCALALGGWGGVLAAALCPHGAGMVTANLSARVPAKTHAHASCHDEGTATDAASNASSHEALESVEAIPSPDEESHALARPAQSCSHCISHRSLPTSPVNAREAQAAREDAGSRAAAAPPPPVNGYAPPAAGFISAIVPTQGAPPGPLARRHLLLSIFII
jgi:hypothetical protein